MMYASGILYPASLFPLSSAPRPPGDKADFQEVNDATHR